MGGVFERVLFIVRHIVGVARSWLPAPAVRGDGLDGELRPTQRRGQGFGRGMIMAVIVMVMIMSWA